jgi:predicted dehydrogenase
MDRRTFLGLAGGAALAQTEKPVRVGFVGVGNRGTYLLRSILDLPGVEVPAVCDIDEANLQRAQAVVEKAGRRRPEGYSNGVEDYRRLAARDDLDAVLTATPWELHTPVCVAAMKAGKYAATEVPAAITLEECWELVNVSEQTGMPCMILENVCFYRNVLMILNMIQRGAFGEISHAAGGYQHYLRSFRPDGGLSWRVMHSLKRDANVYPTHPLGPIAWWTSINRGDRFTHLVSMSSASRGLNALAARRFGPDHPTARRRYAMGDVNTSLLRTANGVTVTLYHDVQLPRPYDLGFRVQGTRGIYSGTLEKIYLEREGEPLGQHEWQDMTPYYEKYEHPIWKKLGQTASKYSHMGGDYIELVLWVAAIRNRTPPPIDVYDAATWSAVTPLSEQSVEARSAPVEFPDFTRGKWQTAKGPDLRL